MEKIHVFDKLCSGIRFSGLGCNFNVNESAIYNKDVFMYKKRVRY